jgi:hypothetical protein
VGINIADYNEMTPYELSIAIEVFNDKQKQENEKQKHEMESMLTAAYFSAYWQRVEKLSIRNLTEVIKKLHGEQTTKKKMTQQEMLNEIKKLNAAFGGTTY